MFRRVRSPKLDMATPVARKRARGSSVPPVNSARSSPREGYRAMAKPRYIRSSRFRETRPSRLRLKRCPPAVAARSTVALGMSPVNSASATSMMADARNVSKRRCTERSRSSGFPCTRPARERASLTGPPQRAFASLSTLSVNVSPPLASLQGLPLSPGRPVPAGCRRARR